MDGVGRAEKWLASLLQPFSTGIMHLFMAPTNTALDYNHFYLWQSVPQLSTATRAGVWRWSDRHIHVNDTHRTLQQGTKREHFCVINRGVVAPTERVHMG